MQEPPQPVPPSNEPAAPVPAAPSRAWRGGDALFALAAVGLWLLLSFLAGAMGELNQDEGWYLLSARLLREGSLPYRDFAFTQGPAMPLVYALLYNWIDRFGLAGVRALTFLFSAVSLGMATWLATRLAPARTRRGAGAVTALLIAVNAYQCQFSCTVKTYALSSLFFLLGILFLTHVGSRRHGAIFPPAAAGVALALAAATRISFAPALGVTGLYLLLLQRRAAAWAWLDFGLGALLALALAFLPFCAAGPEGFRFGLIEYHVLRESGTLLSQLFLKGGAAIRLLGAYLPAFLLLASVVCVRLARRRAGRPAPPEDRPATMRLPAGFHAFLWVLLAVESAVHFAAPFPYDDYQVPLYPLFCALLGAAAAWTWGGTIRGSRKRAALWMLLAVLAVYAVASETFFGWFVAGRDRLWWRVKRESPLRELARAAERAKELAAGQGTILTQDTYLAVEAGLDVPREFAMGPFSYYPDFPDGRARAIGVANRGTLRALLEDSGIRLLVRSGYGFAVACPEVRPLSPEETREIEELVDRHFELVETWPAFGQARTPLEFRVRKERAE